MARGYYGKELRRLIVQMAKRHHLDPHALLAVATVEGGFNGAVGDHGTSFGPFQLHVGGALPAGKDRRWANSHEGIAYAVSRIAGVARGQTGRQAVHSIVYHFERPAAPGAEVERAMGVYGTVHGGGGRGRGGGFYVNPYARGSKLGADQGYDFGMNGPVGAVGKAKIIRSGKIHFKEGWGYIVSYKLLQGPMKGRFIYVMENIRPTVKVGQVVKKGQTIAIAKNHYPYLETGWATPSGSMLAPLGSSKLGRDFFSFLQNAPNYGGGKISSPPDRNNQGMPSPDNQTGQFSQGGLPGLPAPEDSGFAPPGGFESLPGQPGGVAELPGMGNSFIPPDASQNWQLLGDLPGSSPETLAFAQRAHLYNQIGNQ